MKRGGPAEPCRVEVACGVAAPDPLRGSKPRKQVKDAGGIKAEAVADTQTTKFHFLILAKIRSTRRGRVEEELHVLFLRELDRYPPQKVAHRVGGQAPITAVSFSSGVPPHVSLGWNCRTFNGHPRPRGGARPPGRPSGPSRLGTP